MDKFLDDNKLILLLLGLFFVSILVIFGKDDKGITILSNIVSGITGALSMRNKAP